MTELPIRVDWHGNERPASAMEVTRADGTAFEAAVAGFLTVQATMLDRAGGTPERADSMRREDDTLEDPDTFPTAARSALLIARAHLGRS